MNDKKPAKPTPDFPLFAHSNGQWAKKIDNKMHYFGSWDDPQAALKAYLAMSVGTFRAPSRKQESVPSEVPTVNGRQKPKKPYDDFPLFPHGNGQWAKKIRGRLHCFGPWSNPQDALKNYLKDKDDLEAGRPPRRAQGDETLTVKKMVGLFLDDKDIVVQSGEMDLSTWKRYEFLGKLMIQVLGPHAVVVDLGPQDFQRLRKELQKTQVSLSSIDSSIAKIKAFFNWAGPGSNAQGYIDRLPRFGNAFRRPSRASLDRQREESGDRYFTSTQIKQFLAKARLNLKAMILLGVNCGYGNTDCASLPFTKMDLEHGWATFPRTKTGIVRRNPLWPETVTAIREYLESRPQALNPRDEKYVFITKYGRRFRRDSIGAEFEKLARDLGMSPKDADFYDLRRTCTSIGLQVNDDEAMRTIMGHKRAGNDMLGTYNRLPIDDSRLLAVTKYIHDWLFKAPT
jgi:integrase